MGSNTEEEYNNSYAQQTRKNPYAPKTSVTAPAWALAGCWQKKKKKRRHGSVVKKKKKGRAT